MRIITIKKENIITAFLLVVIYVSTFSLFKPSAIEAFMPISKNVVIIDAGHGGWDPGKVGLNGLNEKDLNLQIAQKLQQYLESAGTQVIITRISDEALSSNKRGDLKERKDITNNSNADILISIHQNSFPKINAFGAQVFYHNSSENGEKLANYIQNELKEFVDPSNTRLPKANTDYYMLKTTKIPAVIVECGFISNPEEEIKLNQNDYQKKVAWAIYSGIIDYFNEIDSSKKPIEKIPVAY